MNIYFFIILTLILLLSLNNQHLEGFSSYYLGTPTKCFSCEREMVIPYKYLGGRTKCFSCEKEIVKRYGPQYGSFGQPNKCFSCEKQLGQNPLK